jgi:hypothetical protein
MIEIHPQVISNAGERPYVVLPLDEFARLQAAIESQAGISVIPSAVYGDFWANLSVDELAKRQGVVAVAEASKAYGNGDPNDWLGFDEALESWRSNAPSV